MFILYGLRKKIKENRIMYSPPISFEVPCVTLFYILFSLPQREHICSDFFVVIVLVFF